MSGPAEFDAPDSAVAHVLSRLAGESRTAVLRWAERTVELVRDFAGGLADGVGSALTPDLVPAVALSRSQGSEVRLHWESGGAVFEGVARAGGDAISLTGRVTVAGAPASATSATLSSAAPTRGPESLDADGRFGPWPLSPGENTLRLTGLPLEAGGTAELIVRVDAEAPTGE